MNEKRGGFSAGLTLALATILHAFTHAYGVMLVPLYLLIVADLHLAGVKSAAMLVTVYNFFYCIGSYGAGVLADRMNRKRLLGCGLLLNAAAIALMGLTRRYDLLVGLAVLGGVAGTLFHPAANALIPEHFPKSPGMAIGLLGMGSGLGFFLGPQYSGWRSATATWTLGHTANWQRPCVELGLAGVAFAILFLAFAREARFRRARREMARHDLHPPLGKAMRRRVIAIAAVLGCRDFAGVASLSLASVYLQKALGYDARQTGLILGLMMLIGVVANPLAVYISPGHRRLPSLVTVLIAGGVVVATVPLWPRGALLPVLCTFQALQLGSYAMSDAAMLERVAPRVRGRVVGLFLTLAGTFAGLSPWVMGFWTDAMGAAARRPLPYLWPFGALGLMMALAAFSTPIIARLGEPDKNAISPLDVIFPATMEPAA